MGLYNFVDTCRQKKGLRWFTWMTRMALALGFIPAGYTKLVGARFTLLGLDNPVGFFFEALYRSGFYWNFLGLMQLLAAGLILIPKTVTLGALLFFPILVNIFIIVVSMQFKGTPYIVALMLLANMYLLLWDYQKIKDCFKILLNSRR